MTKRHSTSRIPAPSLLIALSVFCIIGAIVAGGISAADILNGRASRSWPSVTGTVVSSQIRNGSKRTYHADVSYQYAVHGIPYVRDRIVFGQYGSTDKSIAAAWVQKYPLGASVQVSYAPSDPSRSVLEPGVLPMTWVFAAISPAFAAAAFILMVAARRERRRRRQSLPNGIAPQLEPLT